MPTKLQRRDSNVSLAGNGVKLQLISRSWKPIRPGNSKDIQNFADLLDIAVINVKEAGRTEDLGDGSLYLKLQKKMTEPMLVRYHRWVWENYKSESVETLRDWVLQESQFQTIAYETIKGLTKPEGRQTSYVPSSQKILPLSRSNKSV